MHQQAYIFVLFGTLKYKNGQNKAFLVFSSLKNGCSFCFHFWAVSMVFLADFTGSYAIHYNSAQILLPEPQNWPVSRDHFACHFKVIWPVPRFAFVPKWTKPQAGELGNRAKRIDGANGATEATEPTGANGRWSRTKRLRGLSRPIVLICPAKAFRKKTEGAFLHPLNI